MFFVSSSYLKTFCGTKNFFWRHCRSLKVTQSKCRCSQRCTRLPPPTTGMFLSSFCSLNAFLAAKPSTTSERGWNVGFKTARARGNQSPPGEHEPALTIRSHHQSLQSIKYRCNYVSFLLHHNLTAKAKHSGGSLSCTGNNQQIQQKPACGAQCYAHTSEPWTGATPCLPVSG